jgi:hypothetical protein
MPFVVILKFVVLVSGFKVHITEILFAAMLPDRVTVCPAKMETSSALLGTLFVVQVEGSFQLPLCKHVTVDKLEEGVTQDIDGFFLIVESSFLLLLILKVYVNA